MTVVLSLLSSLIWGMSDFTGGLLAKRRPALIVLGWSSVLGFVWITVAALVVGDWSGAATWAPWGLLAGITGATAIGAYYAALASGTMGVVAPVGSLGVVVPVAVGLLSGEQPTGMQVMGILLAVVGVVLASGPELSGGAETRPLVLALVAAFASGCFILCLDQGSQASALMTMWTARAAAAAGFVLLALATRRTGSFRGREVALVAFVSVGDLAANVLLAYATTFGLITITSVLGSMYPVVTALCAYAVLRERLRPVQLVGVAVTMLGVVAIAGG